MKKSKTGCLIMSKELQLAGGYKFSMQQHMDDIMIGIFWKEESYLCAKSQY